MHASAFREVSPRASGSPLPSWGRSVKNICASLVTGFKQKITYFRRGSRRRHTRRTARRETCLRTRWLAYFGTRRESPSPGRRVRWPTPRRFRSGRRAEARATADVESSPESIGDVKVRPSRFHDASVYGRPVVRVASRETGTIVDALRLRHEFLRDGRRTRALPLLRRAPPSVRLGTLSNDLAFGCRRPPVTA